MHDDPLTAYRPDDPAGYAAVSRGRARAERWTLYVLLLLVLVSLGVLALLVRCR